MARDTRVEAHGDLPAYTLRKSARARHVRLTVTPRDGLIVVVPHRMRGFDAGLVLREREQWIAEALAHFADRHAALAAGPDAMLPDHVEFAATGERWPVEYRHTASGSVRAFVAQGMLVVSGSVDDAEACLAALRRWLVSAARDRLIPLIERESALCGLAFSGVTVRGQRSRWGGCSHAGAITLNRALLFLPPELARAIVLHELAHLRQPNHSAAFWRELEGLDPAWRDHREAIKSAWHLVPPWAEP